MAAPKSNVVTEAYADEYPLKPYKPSGKPVEVTVHSELFSLDTTVEAFECRVVKNGLRYTLKIEPRF